MNYSMNKVLVILPSCQNQSPRLYLTRDLFPHFSLTLDNCRTFSGFRNSSNTIIFLFIH